MQIGHRLGLYPSRTKLPANCTQAEVNRMLKACAKGRIAQCKVIDVLARYSDSTEGLLLASKVYTIHR